MKILKYSEQILIVLKDTMSFRWSKILQISIFFLNEIKLYFLCSSCSSNSGVGYYISSTWGTRWLEMYCQGKTYSQGNFLARSWRSDSGDRWQKLRDNYGSQQRGIYSCYIFFLTYVVEFSVYYLLIILRIRKYLYTTAFILLVVSPSHLLHPSQWLTEAIARNYFSRYLKMWYN